MRDLLSWNVYLFRWAGVHVRLHALFLVVMVLVVYLTTRQGSTDPAWYGASVVALLFASVLLHEAGHCLAARKIGGRAEQILIGPLGGLSVVSPSHDRQSEIVITLAGPLVNLIVCFVSLPVITYLDSRELGSLLNPFQIPAAAEHFSWLIFLRLTFWLNWIVLVANLLPAPPLDAARICRAVVRPTLGQRLAAVITARAAKGTAVGLCVLAFLVRTRTEADFAWVALVLLGLFIFFVAKQETDRLRETDTDELLLGYEFSPADATLEGSFQLSARPRAGPVRQWLERRREARRRQRQLLEEAEDRRVDAILAHMQQTGLKGLSPEDRALLQRASMRYRNRQQG